MRSYRPVLAALLAALIIVTSQGMAFARGQTMVAGQIVLCTGHGPQVINVDIDGKKVEQAHLCPDCALAAFVDVPTLEVSSEFVAHRSYRAAWVEQSATLPRLLHTPVARGPPVSF